MIIVISPAKTFKSDLTHQRRLPVFEQETLMLVNKLRNLDLEQIMKTMKVSKKIAQDVKQMYHTFGENQHRAIYSYFGAAYKAFNISSLDNSLHPLLDQRLVILSGLYGIVKPFDTISPYRLEMQYTFLDSLYTFWEEKISDYFKVNHPNEIIISLASEEYRKVLSQSLNVYDIVFKIFDGNTYKSPSMIVKKMRGLMARKLIEDKIENLEDLKKINIEGFLFNSYLSSERQYTFIKNEKNDTL
jgi:uncharacterized protein